MKFDEFILSRDINEFPNEHHGRNRQFEIGNVIIENPANLHDIILSKHGSSGGKTYGKLAKSYETGIGFTISCDDRVHGDNNFRIITISYNQENWPNKGVIQLNENDSSILIYPFFTVIHFKKEFNIFVCAKKVENNPFAYTLYYFDIRGRYIHKEDSPMPFFTRLPTFGYDLKSKSVKKLKPLPENFHLKKIIDFHTYQVERFSTYQVVGTFDLNGIINSDGKWLIEPKFSQIIFWPEKDFSIVSIYHVYYTIDNKDFSLKELDYAIYDSRLNQLRITMGPWGNHKWGMMNNDLEIIHEPIYDYIDYCYTPNRSIIFKGNFWRVGFKTKGTFLNRHLLANKLTLGKCGVINKTGHEIIPVKYDYVKEVSGNNFIVNEGCEIYEAEYENEDDKTEYYRLIRNGRWCIYDLDGYFIKEITISEAKILNNESLRTSIDKQISIE